MEETVAKRDNVVNIILSIQKMVEKTDTLYISMSELEDIIKSLQRRENDCPIVHEYDLPDISVNSLKRNKYIQYIDLYNEIAYKIDEDEAKKIVERNKELVEVITRMAMIDVFNEELADRTANKMVLKDQDPNMIYQLGIIKTFNTSLENKLYTDGKVKVLEELEGYYKVEVSDATFSILTGWENNVLKSGIVSIDSKTVNPGIYYHVLMDSYLININREYGYDNSETPNVLVLRRH